MWFETLVGFREVSANQVRDNLVLKDETLTSRINGRIMKWGSLETPSLGDLREQCANDALTSGKLEVREVVGETTQLHAEPTNANALFQVASQFNLLEMASPSVTPEAGIDIYEFDLTQGPASAIACGAGTTYRNYFVEVDGEPGQTNHRQVDCLRDIGAALGNTNGRLWAMQNGYALATEEGLREIDQRIASIDETERDDLRKRLRVGIQWNTEVTLDGCGHSVSQVLGSALPIAYCSHVTSIWERFARLVLEASYESTFLAAIQNLKRTGCNKLFLTLIGGGVFGNPQSWILDAIQRSLALFRNVDLDVAVVSFLSSKPAVQDLVNAV